MVSAISATTVTSDVLHHHVFDQHTQSWQQRPAKKKPFVKVTIKVDKNSARELGAKRVNVKTQVITDRALPDTGASVTLSGTKLMRNIGITEADLTRCAMRLYGADGNDIDLLGTVPVIITDTVTGRQTKQLLYICHKASSLLLSLEACEDLGYVARDFAQLASNSAVGGKDPNCDCDCPVRERAPDAPTALPYAPTAENVPRMEQWIREQYAASAFNCCECQPLPRMHGPPLTIHMQEGAKPVASHSPIQVPLHWQKKVKAGLDRDEAIGVIEKVPPGTPTTWCHRMVVVPKKDNSPRRTVNFMPLNQYSTRQTHHTMSPFHQATMVPAGTKKTVLDAWNGYHSCLMDEESRHLTTFITPWGRYRYNVAPQGYIASGDAYTRRYDEIVSGIQKKTKCIDDVLIWSDSIEEAFHQTAQWLDICARNGITLNPAKFTFAADTVEFAGFEISLESVRPSQRFLQAIMNFPTPKNITDARSWFGVINQVSYAFSMTKRMEPFRDLLEPAQPFLNGMRHLRHFSMTPSA